jgi:DNA-directed RNA polymerase alpha subunit
MSPILLAPSPNLPDDTEIRDVELPTVIKHALKSAGLRTIGEIRRVPDARLVRFRQIGRTRVTFLRKALGRPQPLVVLELKVKR